MKLIAQHNFHTETQYPAFFSAPVYYKDGYMYYAYGWSPAVICRKISVAGTISEYPYIAPDFNMRTQPYHWKFFEYCGHVILSCGNQIQPSAHFPNKIVCNIFLDVDDGMKEIKLPPEIALQFQCQTPIDETADVVLSDCIIRYKNSRSYQCFDRNGTLLWTEKHKGYRYTHFEERNGCVIFGTAGHGGGLYCYKLSDGTQLCAADTKGTTSYIWIGEYIVTRTRSGELLLVNPFESSRQYTVPVLGLLTDYSSFYTDGKNLCVVAFEKNTNSPCISLFEL